MLFQPMPQFPRSSVPIFSNCSIYSPVARRLSDFPSLNTGSLGSFQTITEVVHIVAPPIEPKYTLPSVVLFSPGTRCRRLSDGMVLPTSSSTSLHTLIKRLCFWHRSQFISMFQIFPNPRRLTKIVVIRY